MGGNRRHGYARGNGGGAKPEPWFCDACQKQHAGRRSRNGTLDGRSLCDRAYYKQANAKLAADRKRAALPAANAEDQAPTSALVDRHIVIGAYAGGGKSNAVTELVAACMHRSSE